MDKVFIYSQMVHFTKANLKMATHKEKEIFNLVRKTTKANLKITYFMAVENYQYKAKKFTKPSVFLIKDK